MALTYHGVDELGTKISPVEDAHRLITSPEHLAAHVRLLQRLGYRFVAADDMVGDEPPSERVACLTFDDGFANWIHTALPVLDRARVVATFYVCPGWYDGQHPDVPGAAGRLVGEADVRRLVEAGMSVGSHSLTHPDLRGLDDAELDRQLQESKLALQTGAGVTCRTLAYPFGLCDDRVAAASARAGYELSWAWVPGPWRRQEAPRLPAPSRHGSRRLFLKMLGFRRFWKP